MFVGTLLVACPLIITAIAIRRGFSMRKANREPVPPKS
jgi:hypothetical protein